MKPVRFYMVDPESTFGRMGRLWCYDGAFGGACGFLTEKEALEHYLKVVEGRKKPQKK